MSFLFSSGFFEMKMKYDESENGLIRASRAVTDTVTGFLGNASLPRIILANITLYMINLIKLTVDSRRHCPCCVHNVDKCVYLSTYQSFTYRDHAEHQ